MIRRLPEQMANDQEGGNLAPAATGHRPRRGSTRSIVSTASTEHSEAADFPTSPRTPLLAKPDPYDQKHSKTKNNFYWRREHCLCQEFARRHSVVSRVVRFEDLPIRYRPRTTPDIRNRCSAGRSATAGCSGDRDHHRSWTRVRWRYLCDQHDPGWRLSSLHGH